MPTTASPILASMQRMLIGMAMALTCILAPHANSQTSTAHASTAPSVAMQITRPDKALQKFPQAQALHQQGRTAEALTLLHTQIDAHHNDPDYHHLIGLLALEAGNPEAALAALERVVLMQPDNAGAWLDLAIATARSGNHSVALTYFKHIQTRFAPPPAIHQAIEAYRLQSHANPTAVGRKAAGWEIKGHAFTGVDSNANSGLLDRIIPLTIGSGLIELALAPAYRPRSDNFIKYGLSARHEQQTDAGQLVWLMDAQQRSYQHEHAFSTRDLHLGLGLIRPTPIGEAGFWLHLEHLSLGNHPLMRNLRLSAQVERPHADCRLGFGLEAELRRFQSFSAEILDANLLWAQAGYACDGKIANTPLQALAMLRIGNDTPIGNRAGGTSHRHELIALISAMLPQRSRLELSATLSSVNDTEGYSPLLGNNAIRHMNRRSLQLAYTRPIGPRTDLQCIIEDSRINSNLALFRQSGRRLSIGLRMAF